MFFLVAPTLRSVQLRLVCSTVSVSEGQCHPHQLQSMENRCQSRKVLNGFGACGVLAAGDRAGGTNLMPAGFLKWA